MPEMDRPRRPTAEPSREPVARLKAMHASGREHHVLLQAPRYISEGRFGVIYEVTAKTVGAVLSRNPKAGSDTRRRSHQFPAIIKAFLVRSDAERALGRYALCRDAGLKTYPTYRVDLAKGVAIMTELNDVGTVTLSCNNWNIRASEVRDLQSIARFDVLVDSLLSEAGKATRAEIELQKDVYFFRVPTDTQTPELDFFAGDFDTIMCPSRIPREKLYRINVIRLHDTLADFVRTYVAPRSRAPLLKMARLQKENFLNRGFPE